MISIRPMDADTSVLYDRIDNRYVIHETISVQYDSAGFSLSYTPLAAPIQRTYPPGSVHTAQELIRREDAECFFAWADGQPAGQAVVTAYWNKLAFLWDIRVDESVRGKGVGSALIGACANWARDKGLKGLLAETQAQNPSACRFYQRNAFILGGVDRLLYTAIQPQPDGSSAPLDCALFFYLLF